MKKWQCRWAPSLGELESTHEEVWGTHPYVNVDDPTVFFGLYGMKDFMTLNNHKGEKAILWAGSDIRHFINGYWLDEDGKVRIDNKSLAKWINDYCENYVENTVEYEVLKKCGIESKIIPSFLGDINKFDITFKPGNKVYTSISGDNFELYGWDKIPKLAKENPDIEFHLYGSDIIRLNLPNIVNHGRVPKEQMNAEIKEMQGALRLTEFDGFSEIIVKSILMGQYPISLIEYPYLLKPTEIREILNKKEPNLKAREYYLSIINKYPWNQK